MELMLRQLPILPVDVNENLTYIGVLICGNYSSRDLHLLRTVSRTSLFQSNLPLQLHIIYMYIKSEQIASKVTTFLFFATP